MSDENANEGNVKGKEVDKTPKTSKETPKDDKTSLEKLKENNDEFEKELVRGRELEAERQKLEANSQLGGTAGGKVEVEVVDPDQAMADKLLADTE